MFIVKNLENIGRDVKIVYKSATLYTLFVFLHIPFQCFPFYSYIVCVHKT